MVMERDDWKRIDAELRANAQQRSGLDAHEMRWLREAEREQIWRPLGMVSLLDYMDRVLGYTPRPRASGCASLAVSRICPTYQRASSAVS